MGENTGKSQWGAGGNNQREAQKERQQCTCGSCGHLEVSGNLWPKRSEWSGSEKRQRGGDGSPIGVCSFRGKLHGELGKGYEQRECILGERKMAGGRLAASTGKSAGCMAGK